MSFQNTRYLKNRNKKRRTISPPKKVVFGFIAYLDEATARL